MKVLVVGSSGIVGRAVAEKLYSLGYEVYGTYLSNDFPSDYPKIRLDITNKESVMRVLKSLNPDWVVHTAAIASVDKCELDKRFCWLVNYLGTKNIAMAVKAASSRLLYVSTAYVFDGVKGNYSENDVPNPISFYGLTKLLGEIVSMSLLEDALVIRLSLVIGAFYSDRDPIRKLVRNYESERTFLVPKDQYISPLTHIQVAEVVSRLLKGEYRGIFHVGGPRISRYELMKRVAAVLGLPQGFIVGVSLNRFSEWIGRRPKDTSLRTDKVSRVVGEELLALDNAMRIVRSLANNYLKFK